MAFSPFHTVIHMYFYSHFLFPSPYHCPLCLFSYEGKQERVGFQGRERDWNLPSDSHLPFTMRMRGRKGWNFLIVSLSTCLLLRPWITPRKCIHREMCSNVKLCCDDSCGTLSASTSSSPPPLKPLLEAKSESLSLSLSCLVTLRNDRWREDFIYFALP